MNKKTIIKFLSRAAVTAAVVISAFSFAGFKSEASLRGSSTEEKIFYFVKDELGGTNAAACGILANVRCESNFNYNAVGDGGTSYGICQWHSSRWTNLKAFCNSNGYDWTTLEGQLYFMKYELENVYTVTNRIVKTYDNTEDNAYWVGYYWCTNYEKPANVDDKKVYRGNLAKSTYWPKYGSNTSTLDSSSSSSSSYLTVGKIYTVNGIKYKAITKKTLTVKGATSKKITKLVIPSKVSIDGKKYKVVSIYRHSFKNYKRLKTVVIGSNITDIGDYAFYKCKNLKKITIKSEDIDTFGKSAFKKVKSKCKIYIYEYLADDYEEAIRSSSDSTVKIKYLDEDE